MTCSVCGERMRDEQALRVQGLVSGTAWFVHRPSLAGHENCFSGGVVSGRASTAISQVVPVDLSDPRIAAMFIANAR